MSKFTKQFKKEYEFEGDVVNVVMKRLKRKAAIKLAPHMTEPDENGKVKMSFEDSVSFADISCEVLKTHVIELTGLKDDDGNAITPEDLFGEDGDTYFMALVSEMLGDLMEASFVGGDEGEKKLEKPQDDTLKESHTKSSTSAE